MAKASSDIGPDSGLKGQSKELPSGPAPGLSGPATVSARQALRGQRVPSGVTGARPNAETADAMYEYYEMKKHPGKYKLYSSFREAMGEIPEDA